MYKPTYIITKVHSSTGLPHNCDWALLTQSVSVPEALSPRPVAGRRIILGREESRREGGGTTPPPHHHHLSHTHRSLLIYYDLPQSFIQAHAVQLIADLFKQKTQWRTEGFLIGDQTLACQQQGNLCLPI